MTTPREQLNDFCSRVISSMDGLRSTNVMRTIGDQAAEIIRTRTRQGFGVDDAGGDQFTLTPLAPSTIKKRERYQAELSGETSPSRSNLTATGQMLDSVGTTAVSSGSVTVAPSGRRSASKLGGGSTSNAEVAGYVAEKGRPFMFLSQRDLSQLWDYLRTTFADYLRNNRIT